MAEEFIAPKEDILKAQNNTNTGFIAPKEDLDKAVKPDTTPIPLTQDKQEPKPQEEQSWWGNIKNAISNFISPTLATPPTKQINDEINASDNLKRNLEGKPSSGGISKPIDLEKTVASALDEANSIPSLNLPGVKGVGDALAQGELQNLGYQLLPDKETGKPTWQYKGTGNYTPEELTNKLTTIKSNITNQSEDIKTDIRDLDKFVDNSEMTKEVTNPEDFKPLSKEELSTISDKKAQKEQQLLDLSDKYSDIKGIYKGIHDLQIQPLSSKDVIGFHETLENQPKDKLLDYNIINPSLETKLSAYQKYISTGMNKDSLIQRGISYAHADDDYEGLKAQEALKNKNVKEAQVNDWQYQGMQPDYQHAQGDLKVDSDILKKVTGNKNAILDEAKKRNIPIQQVQDYVDKLGINHTIDLLTQVTGLEKQTLTNLTGQVDSNLKGLIKYNAVSDEYDRWHNESPNIYGFFHTLNASSTELMTSIVPYFRHLVNVFTPGNNLSEQFGYDNRKSFNPLYYEAQENKDITFPTLEKSFGNSIQETPGETQKVPYTEKGSNLDFLGIGNIISGQTPNWDVAFHNFNKSVIDFSPFLFGGEIEGAVKEVIEGNRALELGSALEEGGGLGYKYTAARAALSTVPKLTGVILPGMLAFGPQNFDKERLIKGLTETQQNVLAIARTFIESAAFLIAPSQMMRASERMVVGEVINPLEDAGYKAAIEKTLFDKYGTKFSDKALRYIFDITANTAKTYGKTALDLSTQMNLALIGDDIASRVVKATVDKNYYDPTREFSLKNIYDTTTEAMATAFSFSLFHMIKGAMDGEFNTQFARESALYRVIQSPEYYLSHIDERLRNGEITKDEALRQTNIINQAEALHLLLKGDYDKVDKTEATDNEKAKLKFELFSNKVKQQGIIEELTKEELKREGALERKTINTELTKEDKRKIEDEAFDKYQPLIEQAKEKRDKATRNSNEEKLAEDERIRLVNERDAESDANVSKAEKEAKKSIDFNTAKEGTLLDYLDKNAAEYVDIKKRTEDYNKLSYEGKLKADAIKEARNVIDQINASSTLEQRQELKGEIDTKRETNKTSKNQNPYLDELYEKASEHLDLKIYDDKYKNAHDQEVTDENQKALLPSSDISNTQTTTKIPEEEVSMGYKPISTETQQLPKANIPKIHALTDGDNTKFESIVLYQGEKVTKVENNGGSIQVDVNNPKMLIDASNTIGYQARAFSEDEDGFYKNDINDEINPQFLELHNPDFNIGTGVTLQVGDNNSPYVAKARKQFLENKAELLELNHITEDEYNNYASNPNNFIPIDILDSKGNVVGNIHTIDYIRSGRVVDFIVTQDGTEIPNLAPNLKDLQKNRERIIDRHNKKQSLDTKISGKNSGTPTIRSDKEFKELKEAFKDRTVLNTTQIVKRPESINYRGNIVLNSESLQPGQTICIVPTPTGDYFGLPLKRTTLEGQWTDTLINSLKFYRDYIKNPTEVHDNIMDEWNTKTHDPTGHDIDLRNGGGLKNYFESIIHVAKLSDYIGSNLDDESKKDIPFIDIDKNGAISFSNGRRNIPTDQDEKNSIKSSYAKLKPIGVNKYDLHSISDDTFAQLENELRFFLKDKSLNIRSDFMDNIKGIEFEIPILNQDLQINSSPEVKNKGQDYQDFVKNNTHTNVIETPMSKGNTYFVQPTISVDLSYEEPKNVKNLDNKEDNTNFTQGEDGPSHCK